MVDSQKIFPAAVSQCTLCSLALDAVVAITAMDVVLISASELAGHIAGTEI